MKDISLLLSTRGHPLWVYRLLDSILETTSNLTNLEIVLLLDEDDKSSHEIVYPALPIVKLIRPRVKNMGEMNRECYEASSGRYLMVLNDDVVFCAPEWAEMI
jgi:hypothetical protein